MTCTPEEEIFDFWMDYFVEATKTEIDDSIRFPVSKTIPSSVIKLLRCNFLKTVCILDTHFRTIKSIYA